MSLDSRSRCPVYFTMFLVVNSGSSLVPPLNYYIHRKLTTELPTVHNITSTPFLRSDPIVVIGPIFPTIHVRHKSLRVLWTHRPPQCALVVHFFFSNGLTLGVFTIVIFHT